MNDLSDLREAIRRERKLSIRYQKLDSEISERIIWPIAIGYFPNGKVLVGWCENSNGFWHFRTDRILAQVRMQDRVPKRRNDLLREWRQEQLIS